MPDNSERCGCKTGFFQLSTCPQAAIGPCARCAGNVCAEHARPSPRGVLCPRCASSSAETPPGRPAREGSDPGASATGTAAFSRWAGSSSDSASGGSWSGGGGAFAGGGASGGWAAAGQEPAGTGGPGAASLGVVAGGVLVGTAAAEGFTEEDFAAMEGLSELRPDQDKGQGFES